MALHKNITPVDGHIVYSLEYANASARTSAVLVSSDIGRIARQTDNGSFWILTSNSPTTWLALGSSDTSGSDWQESVLNRLATPPGSPVTGDRYLVIPTGTGAWVGKENQIAQWDGASWGFTVPNEGMTVRVEAENLIYTFDGSVWGNIGNAVNHSVLLNLTSDDHTQYLNRSGIRAMTGALDMGTFNVTNAGTVNGVSVTAHASRHNPGGLDAVATANVVAITDSTNAEGTATSLSRSDHSHAHGNRSGGNLHATASASGAGFYPQSNFAATVNPAVSNDNTQGYVVGSKWTNTTNGTVWQAVGVATGAAVWKELTNTTVNAIGLVETSGPTNLAIGAVSNGQFLIRSGGTIVGTNVSGSSVLIKTADAKIASDTTTTSATFVDLLSFTVAVSSNGFFVIQSSGAVSNSNANVNMRLRLTLDGVSLGGVQVRSPAANIGCVFSINNRVAVTPGNRVVALQWARVSGTMQCRPVANPDAESASLIVQEVSA